MRKKKEKKKEDISGVVIQVTHLMMYVKLMSTTILITHVEVW